MTRRGVDPEDLQARLEHVLTSGPTVFYLLALETLTPIFISPNVEKVLGYTPEEIVGHPGFWRERVHPDDLEETSRKATLVLQTGKQTQEYRFRLRQGKYVWLRDEMSLWPGDPGHSKEVVGSFTDITTQRQAQEDLAREQERFRVLVEESPFGVSIIDKSGQYQYINPKFTDLFGYSREDIPTGRDWFRLAYPDPVHRQAVVAKWKTAVAQTEVGEVRPQAFTVTCKDGGTKLIRFRPAKLANGDLFIIYEDVTQQQAALEALRESEERYRTLFEAAQDGIFLMIEDVILSCNPAAERLFGMSRERLVGTSPFHWSPAYQSDGQESRTKGGELLRQAHQGKLQRFEWLHQDASGRLFEGEISLSQVQLMGQTMVLALVRDITERKQAEAALRASEEKYRLLVNQIPAVVFKGYPDWSVDFFDHKVEDLTGYAKEDFDRRLLKWNDLILPEDIPPAQKVFREALQGNLSYVREYRIRKKEGEICWVQARGQIFFDPTGEIDYISGVLFDSTAHRHMQESLQESEERFKFLFDYAPDAYFLHDVRGNFLAINKAAEEILGRSQAEINHQDFFFLGLLDTGQEAKVKELLSQITLGRPIGPEELTLIRRDGSKIPVEVRSYPVNFRGKPLVLGLARDISKRKQAEDDLRQSQEQLYQAQKLKSLGTLVAGVAHEINNPINLILFNISLLKDIWGDLEAALRQLAQEEPQRKYGGLSFPFLQENLPRLLDDVDMAAHRVARTVTTLKDFSRQSRLSEKAPVQLNQAVERAVAMAQSTLRKSGVELQLDLATDLPEVTGNLQNLEQVILNLTLNAIEAIDHRHGLIRLTTGYDSVRGWVWLQVADNGQGINPAIASELFDPFVTDKQALGGSGLGLAVTYNLVKSHGGEISFDSQPGEGTVFTITFPVTQ